MTSTRDRIIVATNELFRRRGYNGTSLSQISEASGATVGSIYHFFPGGKEALAVAVIDTTGAIYRELFESIAADASDPAQAYRDFFSGAGAVLEETGYIDPCPIGTIAREVADTSPLLRAAAGRAFASWLDSVRDHLRTAGLPDDVADDLAMLVVSTIEGTFVLSRTLRDTAVLEAAGRQLGALVDAALTKQAAGRL